MIETLATISGSFFFIALGLYLSLLAISKIGQFFGYWNLMLKYKQKSEDLEKQMKMRDAFECLHWRQSKLGKGADGRLCRQCLDCGKFIPEKD